MLLDIVAPYPLLSLKLRMDLSDNFCKKSTCTCCRIQNLHFVYFFLYLLSLLIYLDLDFRGIGQSLWQIKFCLEDIIHCTNDEIDYRMRSIPHPTCLAQFRIILTQESFIKVNDRIFCLGRPAVVFEDILNITCEENLDEIIYDPF